LAAGFQLTGTIPNAYCSDGQWQYIEHNEGVALYRSLNETEGLLPFKAVAELDVPYERIIMALVDAERKPLWAPKLKATTIHSQISSNRFEYSEYYKTPWPFKDREFLLIGTVAYERNRVVFSAANSDNQSLADKDHLMANIQELTFIVTPIAEKHTKVAFTFSGDLGGWIPDFVKTIIQKRWPVRFIQALRGFVAENGQLETPRYRSLNKTLLEVPQP
jgi:hypothetical protein